MADNPRLEPLHERDCPACSLAIEIADAYSDVFDPLDNWPDTQIPDGLPGDTVLTQARRLAAYVLHRRLPGHSWASGGQHG